MNNVEIYTIKKIKLFFNPLADLIDLNSKPIFN